MKTIIPTTADTAYQFALLLASHKKYAEVYSGFPDYLIAQASEKFKYFELNNHLVGEDYVRVTLLNPTQIDTNTIAVKFKLGSVINMKTGAVRVMCAEHELDSYETYTKGFNSPLIEISRGCGVLNDTDFNTLVRYCNWWNSVNPWTAATWNQRVYIKPAQASFLMQFMLEMRINPKTGEEIVGLTENVFLRDATILATFGSDRIKGAVGKPRKQRGGTKIDIPMPQRQSN